MGLKLLIGDAVAIGPGVWNAQLAPADVRRLGDGKNSIGERSIVGLFRASFDAAKSVLSISPDDTSVLNIGTTNEALFVDLRGNPANVILDPPPGLSPRFGIAEVKHRATGIGDRAFLGECQRHLDQRLVDMAKRLLSEIREHYPGELREGKARKWLNQPNNFVAVTIQNRDQSFAVHVKGAPNTYQAPSLEIKKDRGSYSRFKLKHDNQILDTIQVVLSSAHRSGAAVPPLQLKDF